MKCFLFFLSITFFLDFNNTATAQNVGIGITTPAEKLHVAGNIKADTIKPSVLKVATNAGTGKVLTSDATGNASWQTNTSAGSSAAGNIGYGVWGDCATNGNISEYNPIVDNYGAAGDNFGNSVSVSGNFAVVGDYGDDVGANVDQGSASVYQYNGSGWVLMQQLIDPTGAAGDYFGTSVSISGNFIIVSAYADDANSFNLNEGSASIYKYNGSSWVFMQKLIDANGGLFAYFGYSVSISGNYAIVGAYNDDVGSNADQGSASIFQYNGSSWVLMQKITDATGGASYNFGNSVSISGNFAIVGAYHEPVGNYYNLGSASIFQYNGANWVLKQKLFNTGTLPSSVYFGTAVSISGNYAVVSTYVDYGLSKGTATVYQYANNTWSLMQKITDPNLVSQDYFGISVTLSGDYLIIGAYHDDVGANTDQGSADIYYRLGNAWGKLQTVSDPIGAAGDLFGISAAIDGTTKRFLIGANGYANSSGKVVFGKVN